LCDAAARRAVTRPGDLLYARNYTKSHRHDNARTD